MEEKRPEQATAALRERMTLYARQPPMDEAVALCVRAWHDLETCRAVGMRVGPIPWTAIDVWACREGLGGESMRLLHDVIRHLEIERARIEQAHRNLNKASGGKRR